MWFKKNGFYEVKEIHKRVYKSSKKEKTTEIERLCTAMQKIEQCYANNNFSGDELLNRKNEIDRTINHTPNIKLSALSGIICGLSATMLYAFLEKNEFLGIFLFNEPIIEIFSLEASYTIKQRIFTLAVIFVVLTLLMVVILAMIFGIYKLTASFIKDTFRYDKTHLEILYYELGIIEYKLKIDYAYNPKHIAPKNETENTLTTGNVKDNSKILTPHRILIAAFIAGLCYFIFNE